MPRRKIYEILLKYKIYGVFIVVVVVAGFGLLASVAKPIIDFEQCDVPPI